MMDVLALEAVPSSSSFMLAGVASFLPLVAVSNSTPVSFKLGISPCARTKLNAGLTPLLSMTLIVSTSCATVSSITRLSGSQTKSSKYFLASSRRWIPLP